jgi:hypothetical protein
LGKDGSKQALASAATTTTTTPSLGARIGGASHTRQGAGNLTARAVQPSFGDVRVSVGGVMTYEKKAMTAFAQAALAASDLIMQKFHETKFQGKVVRIVNVEAPNVESTGGGKQARESIVLRPENGDQSQSVTCGFLDIGLRSCELRSYGTVNMQHKQRYNSATDLIQAEYDAFLGSLRAMLEAEGFVIKIIEPQEQAAKAQAAGAPVKQGGSNTAVMVALAVVAALVLAAVGAFLVFKH